MAFFPKDVVCYYQNINKFVYLKNRNHIFWEIAHRWARLLSISWEFPTRNHYGGLVIARPRRCALLATNGALRLLERLAATPNAHEFQLLSTTIVAIISITAVTTTTIATIAAIATTATTAMINYYY